MTNKHLFLGFLSLLFLTVTAPTVEASGAATDVRLDNGVVMTPAAALGPDKPYDFTPVELTPAPDGYSEVLIEHYGRHGSRYAYSNMFYTDFHKAVTTAQKKGILTELGKKIGKDFLSHYDTYMLKMGDLAPLGRAQQEEIARRMYKDFREAFGENATVYASASQSQRSIMSMTAFCLGLKGIGPSLKIEAETGKRFLDGTNPRDKANPFQVTRHCPESPFVETRAEFMARKVDSKTILSRLFTDVDAACGDMNQADFVWEIYTLAVGMNSIPEDERTDFTGLLTAEETARIWEAGNYGGLRTYFSYLPKCLPVLLDIQADANKRLSEGSTGATCRFGHDHVMLPLLLLLGINGYDRPINSPDEASKVYHNWDSCMATNLQFVFYKQDKANRKGSILFKVLLNGRESTLPLHPVSGCYYEWNDFQSYLNGLTKKYHIESPATKQ